MARTKGAVDKRPRKRSNVVTKPRIRATKPAEISAGPKLQVPAPEDAPGGVNPAFLQSIEAALGGPASEPQVEPGAQGATTGTTSPCTPAPTLPDDPPLTREAWESVLRVPFRLVAQAAGAPRVATIGDKRAKDLAKPSYVIFEHYAREYMAMNPDNPLSLAWAATILVLCDVGADVAVEISRARGDRRRAELPAGPAEGQPLNQAA